MNENEIHITEVIYYEDAVNLKIKNKKFLFGEWFELKDFFTKSVDYKNQTITVEYIYKKKECEK